MIQDYQLLQVIGIHKDLLDSKLDGQSGSGLARDLHDEPSRDPMTLVKDLVFLRQDLDTGMAKACKARQGMTWAAQAKARQGYECGMIVATTISWSMSQARQKTNEIGHQWQVVRGITFPQGRHVGKARSWVPKWAFGARFEGCLRVPRTSVDSWTFSQFLDVCSLSAE